MSDAARVVVVTGSGAGIGAATAERLLTDGYTVVGIDRDTPTLTHPAFVPVIGDVSEWIVHDEALSAARQHGALHGWVNNAGIEVHGGLLDVSRADVDRQLGVNLVGVIGGCRAAVRGFLEGARGGAIVNVSSVQSVVGFPDSLAYQASKGGVDAVTRQIAVDYGYAGIRSVAVRPGVVMTEMSHRDLAMSADPLSLREQWDAMASLQRCAEPAEIASVIAFLLGSDASFITGTCIDVDGGLVSNGAREPVQEPSERIDPA